MLGGLKRRLARAVLGSLEIEDLKPALMEKLGRTGGPSIETPVPEEISISNFAPSAGPLITSGTPNEREDCPEERDRLVAILLANPSGLSGAELLDRYRIPPSTIEFGMRDGQVGKAERGIGATHKVGGPWAPIVPINPDLLPSGPPPISEHLARDAEHGITA